MPLFVNTIIGWLPGLTGIFISSVFSASLSTISAYLNTISAIIYMDYVKKIRGFKHTEKRAFVCMKSIIIIMGIYSVLGGILVEHLGPIFQVFLTIIGMTMGAVNGIFTLGMLFPRANSTVFDQIY